MKDAPSPLGSDGPVRPAGSARRAGLGLSGRSRIMAAVALVALCGLVVAVIIFLLRSAGYVFLGLAGAAISIGGAWWFLTGRRHRRAVGAAGLVAGIGVMAAALVWAGVGGEQVLVRLIVVAGISAVGVSAGRAAMLGTIRTTAAVPFRRRPPPSRPVLICNPWSGDGKVEKFGLVDLAKSLGVETVLLDRGLDLEQLARDAIERGADCLGMAGGDGSQALVASIAIEHDIPFVCVSAGTRNHFALDLGLERDDPRRTMDSFRDGLERRVDFATVNGRLFVNNVSLGVYATIVQQEGYREAKLETSSTLLPDLLGQSDKPFDLQFTAPDGSEVEGSLVIQVSNNPYVLGPSPDVSQRLRLDSGQLGVFAVAAGSGTEAASVVAAMLAGRQGRSRHALRFATKRFEVRSRSGQAFVGVDGEALELATPLDFAIHPMGLRLLVPEGNLEQATRRRAREVHLGDLVGIARGRAGKRKIIENRNAGDG
jgi:diacylglycerol kinase family enzyme